jgi:PTS system mannose-specific IIA component
MTASGPGGAGPRPGLLVVTHGGLAFELVRALEKIVGTVERVRALSIGWDDDPNRARADLQQALEEVDAGGGVLILTDMFGGTATNLALAFLRDGVEIVTGVNLPMLVKFVNLRAGVPLQDAATSVREQGQRSITRAGDVLGARPAGETE